MTTHWNQDYFKVAGTRIEDDEQATDAKNLLGRDRALRNDKDQKTPRGKPWPETDRASGQVRTAPPDKSAP